jgi:Lamin Tail Domain
MRFATALTLGLLLTPSFALAFPFGGQASTVVPCYNRAIFARLGAPRGGDYIWTSSTKTYQFGPPSFAGQWLLGLASAPYYCVVSIEPVIVWAGIAIDMMGSSGGAAGSINSLLSGAAPTTAAPAATPTYKPPVATPTSSSVQPLTIGHIVISEIYYNVDSKHGGKPLNQWLELFNGGMLAADLSGWKIQSTTGVSTLPAGTTILAGHFLFIEANSATAGFWNLSSTTQIVLLSSPAIAGGFLGTGDAVTLKDSSGTIVDSVGWGSNTSIFNPSAPASAVGYSTARKGLSQDTNSAADWFSLSAPTPGR